jgi:hypothetical protein
VIAGFPTGVDNRVTDLVNRELEADRVGLSWDCAATLNHVFELARGQGARSSAIRRFSTALRSAGAADEWSGCCSRNVTGNTTRIQTAIAKG